MAPQAEQECYQELEQFWGKDWKRLEGGGLLIAPQDTTDGWMKNRKVFLFPDLIHAIIGTFDQEKNTLISGFHAKVTGFEKCPASGILAPHFETDFDGTQSKAGTDEGELVRTQQTFEAPSHARIALNPKLKEPYEWDRCYVKKSLSSAEAGEGLFARKKVERSGILLALFSGTRKRRVVRSVPVAAGEPDWSDYAISLDKEISIDIPKGYESIDNYCATLGHKVCHSFEPNSAFRPFFHPRFGRIMSVVSLKPIAADEEILVHYRYSINYAPLWYRDLWRTFLRGKGWSYAQIERHGYYAHEVDTHFEQLCAKFDEV